MLIHPGYLLTYLEKLVNKIHNGWKLLLIILRKVQSYLLKNKQGKKESHIIFLVFQNNCHTVSSQVQNQDFQVNFKQQAKLVLNFVIEQWH